MLKPSPILTDIADAIREKDQTTAPIPVPNYAARIMALPTPPPTGWPSSRRVYRFAHFLSQEEQDELELLRCDGRPAYEVYAEIFDMFKPSPPNDWNRLVGRIPGMGTSEYQVLAGNKLYLGSPSSFTASTSIQVLDTITGKLTEITGLPSRIYTTFRVVGHKIYCLHNQSNIPSINSIVCIDTTDDTFKLIMMPASLSWGGSFTLVGHRLFVGPNNNSTTYMAYIDTDIDVAYALYGLPSKTHGQHFLVGTKLYVAGGSGSTSYTSIVVIDTTKIGTAESPVSTITGLPNLYYEGWYLAGRFLYVGSSFPDSQTTIVRIDTQTDEAKQIGPIPARRTAREVGLREYAFPGALIGNKVYVGGTTAVTSIIVINNNVAGVFREVTGLPSREYDGFQLIGDKLYVAANTGATTLIIIDTDADVLLSEITGLPHRAYNRFFLNGAILYLLSTSVTTGIVLLNTANDTFTEITGLTSRAQGIWIVVHGRLYLGSGVVIDLATNIFIEEIPGWVTTRMSFINEKIYSTMPNVLTRSVLPNHAFPIYVKYGS